VGCNSLKVFMKKKKIKLDGFAMLVQQLNSRTQLNDKKGKGVVKGKDVARMVDYLKEEKVKT